MQLKANPKIAFDYSNPAMIDMECFPQQIVPVAVDMLMRRYYAGSWAAEELQDGQDAIARAIMSIYQGCVNKTADSVDRVYRLINTLYTGQVYTWSSDGEGVVTISPDIPIVPAPMPTMPLAYALEALQKQIDNGMNGTPYGGYPNGPGQRALLQSILDAINAQENQDPEEIINILQLILAALA